MTVPNELRLLPWSGPEGKPCYLSTDDREGYMSRLADYIEAAQLGRPSCCSNKPRRSSTIRARTRRTCEGWRRS